MVSRQYTLFNLILRATKPSMIRPSISYRLEIRAGIHSAVRRKLEKIHAKREAEATRSQELLQKLRKKRLDGLTESPLLGDAQLGEKLQHMKHIRRLLSTFHSKKHDQELTLPNTVQILKKIAEIFERDPKQRVLLLENSFHCQLVQEVIDRVSSSCGKCSPTELCDSVVALANLNEKGTLIFRQFEQVILSHGMGQFTYYEMGFICWAFAKAETKGAGELCSAVIQEVETKEIVSFSSKTLCQIAWLFVCVKFPVEKQLRRIGLELFSRDIGMFEPGMLSMVAHVYSSTEITPISDSILTQVEREIHRYPELKDFPTYDLVLLTTALLRRNSLESQTFRKLETVLVTRRNFLETTPRKYIEELCDLLKESPFFLAEIGKILERVLHPEIMNSVFDIFYRPRRSWKEKVLKQSVFRVY